MNSQNTNGWPTSSGPGTVSSLNNDHPPAQSRQISSFGYVKEVNSHISSFRLIFGDEQV